MLKLFLHPFRPFITTYGSKIVKVLLTFFFLGWFLGCGMLVFINGVPLTEYARDELYWDFIPTPLYDAVKDRHFGGQ